MARSSLRADLLGSFQPGSEAEPPGLEQAVADTTPTVLTKLQKWVRPPAAAAGCRWGALGWK